VLKASAWRSEQVVERARGRRGLAARGQSEHGADAREAESACHALQSRAKDATRFHPVQGTRYFEAPCSLFKE